MTNRQSLTVLSVMLFTLAAQPAWAAPDCIALRNAYQIAQTNLGDALSDRYNKQLIFDTAERNYFATIPPFNAAQLALNNAIAARDTARADALTAYGQANNKTYWYYTTAGNTGAATQIAPGRLISSTQANQIKAGIASYTACDQSLVPPIGTPAQCAARLAENNSTGKKVLDYSNKLIIYNTKQLDVNAKQPSYNAATAAMNAAGTTMFQASLDLEAARIDYLEAKDAFDAAEEALFNSNCNKPID